MVNCVLSVLMVFLFVFSLISWFFFCFYCGDQGWFLHMSQGKWKVNKAIQKLFVKKSTKLKNCLSHWKLQSKIVCQIKGKEKKKSVPPIGMAIVNWVDFVFIIKVHNHIVSV